MKLAHKLLGTVALVMAFMPAIANAEDKSISFVECGDKMSAVHTELIAKWEAANPGFKEIGRASCRERVLVQV